MNIFREIPEHHHTSSVYTHCLDCHLWGINLPVKFTDASECGNCQSIHTVKYYPSCCIIADRQDDHDCEAEKEETERLLLEASKKIGW